ncbi:SMP-30/gluconolactonase/LRE family protein [Streptomyces sp. NPDC020917]|uniref:SMP-30/gluconolactonase/LRE family protein n=1 Tax=Streptomyces sp. NPDC020917 TaxID=3365102 RepID=UPI0037AF9ED2
MSIEITVAIPDTARVGEGPCWDPETGRLSWVDILSGTIHDDDPQTAVRSRIQLPPLVGAAVRKTSGGFVAANAEGFADIDRDGRWTQRAAFLPPGVRMNDAKCDVSGRLWAGSCAMDFDEGRGALHVLRPDWTTETVIVGLTQPNGLDWSPDGSVFYLIDTQARELTAGDVVPGRLAPEDRRVLTRFPEALGYPDGMTVDTEGYLWIAMWGGGRLLRVSPAGEIVSQVDLPVVQPSSCAFGGPDLDVLYVTTAREGLAPQTCGPSGSVLAVAGLGVRGLPGRRFGG